MTVLIQYNNIMFNSWSHDFLLSASLCHVYSADVFLPLQESRGAGSGWQLCPPDLPTVREQRAGGLVGGHESVTELLLIILNNRRSPPPDTDLLVVSTKAVTSVACSVGEDELGSHTAAVWERNTLGLQTGKCFISCFHPKGFGHHHTILYCTTQCILILS